MAAELDFELEYPDSFELSPTTWSESERSRRVSTSVFWYPITPPGLSPLPSASSHLHTDNCNDLVFPLPEPSPGTPIPSNYFHSQTDECVSLGLPLPYPVFTDPPPKSMPVTPPKLNILLEEHSYSGLPSLKLHYDYLIGDDSILGDPSVAEGSKEIHSPISTAFPPSNSARLQKDESSDLVLPGPSISTINRNYPSGDDHLPGGHLPVEVPRE